MSPAGERPTRFDHLQFCLHEGWTEVQKTHHVTFKLRLPDGTALRTRLSRPPDNTPYADLMWTHILRNQLQVTPEEFRACVDDGVMPDRGFPEPPKETLPAELAYLLATKVGLNDRELALLTREAAIDRLNRYWSEGR